MRRIALVAVTLGSIACGGPAERPPVVATREARPVTAAARIRHVSDDEVARVSAERADAQVIGHGWIAEGLPGLSADGQTIAIVQTAGNGSDDHAALLVLSAVDASLVGREALFDWRAGRDDDSDEALAAFEAALPAAMQAADDTLTRGDYHALVRIPSGDEPAIDGLPVLRFTDGGAVTVHDAADAHVRFEGRVLAAPAETVVIGDGAAEPDGEDDEDDDGEDDPCLDRFLEEASAWLIDSSHALLDAKTNSAADECDSEHVYRTIELTP